MASGALPPAFPAVRIDGELYWDGGILSNTPVEACSTTTRGGIRWSSPCNLESDGPGARTDLAGA